MSRQEGLPEPRIYRPFLKLILMMRERRLAAIVGRLGADCEAGNEDPTASGIAMPRGETALGPLLTMILEVSGMIERERRSARQETTEKTSCTRNRELQPVAIGARLCCRVPH
ncbi:MAG TPA: hypothetical protein VKB58_10000 [Terriglobales bacterium]|jgi:hypothetical protein|nr:hypothetical protein [Terriglobales bacterium]